MTLRPPAFLAAVSLLLASAVPAGAFDVFLDYNTDNNPDTFENLVEGPLSAPVDVIVSFDAGDLGTTAVSFLIQWGYNPPNPGGNQDCYDVQGGILGYVSGTPLADTGPFTNIIPLQCVCRPFRCQCDAELLIQADVTGLTQPGNYVIASLELSRVGYALANCGQFTWAQSDFETYCLSPSCATSGDPRATLTITDGSTAVRYGTWGQVKALYR